MKYSVWIIFLIVVSAMLACSPNEKASDIKEFWKEFTKIIKSKNGEKLKHISLPVIYCPDCRENTAEEKSYLNNLRIINPDSSEKIQGSDYISIEKFIREDFEKIFTADLSKFKQPSKVGFVFREFEKQKEQAYLNTFLNEGKKYLLHEVLITIEDPSTQHTGRLKIIQILETNKGFKFFGYTTVP